MKNITMKKKKKEKYLEKRPYYEETTGKIKQTASWSKRGSVWRKKRESIVEIYIRICPKKKKTNKLQKIHTTKYVSRAKMSEVDE